MLNDLAEAIINLKVQMQAAGVRGGVNIVVTDPRDYHQLRFLGNEADSTIYSMTYHEDSPPDMEICGVPIHLKNSD